MLRYSYGYQSEELWNTAEVHETARAIVKLDLNESTYMVGLLADIELRK